MGWQKRGFKGLLGGFRGDGIDILGGKFTQISNSVANGGKLSIAASNGSAARCPGPTNSFVHNRCFLTEPVGIDRINF